MRIYFYFIKVTIDNIEHLAATCCTSPLHSICCQFVAQSADFIVQWSETHTDMTSDETCGRVMNSFCYM